MKLDLIIPVYRNVEFVEACITSLHANLREVSAYEPRLIVINDSPDDAAVTEYLERARSAGIIHDLIANPANVGFVKSVNKGLALARERGAAALLINSDTITYRDTLAEMTAVLNSDPQIGFVCPRSNNASISTFPQVPHNMSEVATTPDSCYRAWQSVHHYLDRFTWAPTAVGFYMLIAADVVRNFGKLDEEFGLGYEEENDLVMRAGKVGYRAVMANHAFAYHAGSASFLLRDMDLKGQQQDNLEKMSARHPEFLPLVRAHEASVEHRAELKIRQLVPTPDGKLKIALNLLTFGRHHNGTSEHMMHFVRWCEKAAPDNVEIHAICQPSVARFHGLDEFERVKVRKNYEARYAISICPGQPFDLQTIDVMEHLAPINVYGMLDVIALDCSHLRATNALQSLWGYVAQHANGLFFNSAFSELTFRNRFSRQFGAAVHTELLPTKIAAYAARFKDIEKRDHHVLVMGNHFLHKASDAVGGLIAKARPDLPMVILGGSSKTVGNARTMQSGVIPEDEMNALLARASVVVLPSYCEGFGLSIMNALALGKPVVARDIAPTREILATYGSIEGIYLFKDNADIPGLVDRAIADGCSNVQEVQVGDWDGWSKRLFDFCLGLVDDPCLYTRLLNRLEQGDALRGVASSPQEEIAAALSTGGGAVDVAALLTLDHDRFVRAFYEQLLGRSADPAGLEHHVALLNGGMTKVHMLNSILASEEFVERRSSIIVNGRELLQPKRRRFWFSKSEG